MAEERPSNYELRMSVNGCERQKCQEERQCVSAQCIQIMLINDAKSLRKIR